MSDFNLKVTVRNAHLLRAIRRRFDTAAAFARAFGLSNNRLAALINMRESPLRKDGSTTQFAEMVCDALGKNLEDLWPGKMVEMRRRTATHEVELTMDQAMQIADPLNAALQRKMLADWSVNLRPRELQVISLRNEGATLDEAGLAMSLSKERVRPIECKALRKMREAAWKQGVKSFVDAAVT